MLSEEAIERIEVTVAAAIRERFNGYGGGGALESAEQPTNCVCSEHAYGGHKPRSCARMANVRVTSWTMDT